MSANSNTRADHEVTTKETNDNSDISSQSVDPPPIVPRRSPRLQQKLSYAAVVASSLPKMFGFSPYVSAEKTTINTGKVRLTKVRPSSTAREGPATGPRPQQPPTMPRGPRTRSETRSWAQGRSSRRLTRRWMVTSPLMLTRAPNGVFLASTTPRWASASGRWRASCSPSSSRMDASKRSAAASSAALTGVRGGHRGRRPHNTSVVPSKRPPSSSNKLPCNCSSTPQCNTRPSRWPCSHRRTDRRRWSTTRTHPSGRQQTRRCMGCPSGRVTAPRGPHYLHRARPANPPGNHATQDPGMAGAMADDAPGIVPRPASAGCSCWPGPTRPDTPPRAASPTSRTSSGKETGSNRRLSACKKRKKSG